MNEFRKSIDNAYFTQHVLHKIVCVKFVRKSQDGKKKQKCGGLQKENISPELKLQ